MSIRNTITVTVTIPRAIVIAPVAAIPIRGIVDDTAG